jgi:glycosyltransferase involved in cell wall biosynthesis
VSTYVRELLPALVDEIGASTELVAAVRPVGATELPAGVEPLIKKDTSGIRRAVTGLLGFGHADLVHGMDVDLPLKSFGPAVSTVHDLAVFDAPWAFPRHRVAGERLLVRRSLRRADAIIAVSSFTAERIHALFGLEATVTHLAPSREMHRPAPAEIDRVRSHYRLPEVFVLHVGNVEPRKDLATLAEACRRAPIPLILTGHSLWGSRPPEGAVEIGHVPGSDLPALYGAATVVGYSSRYEGFGLPPIEAMACGAPVVSTPVPSIVEVVGDGAEVFRPGDVDALTKTLRRLASDEAMRSDLAARGRARVETMSWARCAEGTAGVYRSCGLRL